VLVEVVPGESATDSDILVVQEKDVEIRIPVDQIEKMTL
jgi:hypothetical protein